MTASVFLSQPNEFSSRQESEIRRWQIMLESMGLRTLASLRRVPKSELWPTLRNTLLSSHGVVIFGLSQTLTGDGVDLHSAKYRTTPRIQLEAGMAIMAGLPVLVLLESPGCGGILESDTWTEPVYGTNLRADCSDPMVVKWYERVSNRAQTGSEVVSSISSTEAPRPWSLPAKSS
jgi:hypothetical protein